MRSTRVFSMVCGLIVAALAALIVWASLEKSVIEIFRVLLAERWGIVTLLDLYGGFLITGAWIAALERRWWRVVPWLAGMFFLGNFASLIYVALRAWRARTFAEVFFPRELADRVSRDRSPTEPTPS
jgi:hypothetical protein